MAIGHKHNQAENQTSKKDQPKQRKQHQRAKSPHQLLYHKHRRGCHFLLLLAKNPVEFRYLKHFWRNFHFFQFLPTFYCKLDVQLRFMTSL